jgi:nicotinamidase-related amidase
LVKKQKVEKPAVIIVDMIRDNVDVDSPFSIGKEARRIIPKLQHLLAASRKAGFPVIFANNSFMLGDFIFRSGLKPHALRETEGAKVIAELEPQQSDIVIEKRKASAFFETDLDITLRRLGVDTIAVAGVATEVCVLATALDGMTNDFKVIMLQDCCTSSKRAAHDAIIEAYRNSALPKLLFRVMSLNEFLSFYGV